MLKLIVRRLLAILPLLLAVSFITFFLLFHSPGDYLARLRLDPKISTELIEREAHRLGLDQPFYIVWIRWIWGVVRHGDFGQSFTYKIPVLQLIGSRLYATFLLALTSTIFAWIIGVPLGILAASRHNKLADRMASAIAFVGLSVPSVLLALFAVYFAAKGSWFPTSGMRSDNAYQFTSNWQKMLDIGRHLILPTIVLGMGGLAVYARQMRSNLLETLDADYVRTARSKGVTRRSAILKHASRNAINPLISLFGFAFADLLSGAVLVENVMAWPGLGRLVVESYFSKDMFVVAASVVLSTLMLVLGNLVADILLAAADPRIRYE
jgi:peptide/nickel transport system permease protein